MDDGNEVVVKIPNLNASLLFDILASEAVITYFNPALPMTKLDFPMEKKISVASRMTCRAVCLE
jgi:hypothetical protein